MPLSVTSLCGHIVDPRREYQLRTDKDSSIVNDPNDWATEHDDPAYILNLVKRIVTVSVETMKIVKRLPPLEELN